MSDKPPYSIRNGKSTCVWNWFYLVCYPEACPAWPDAFPGCSSLSISVEFYSVEFYKDASFPVRITFHWEFVT